MKDNVQTLGEYDIHFGMNFIIFKGINMKFLITQLVDNAIRF